MSFVMYGEGVAMNRTPMTEMEQQRHRPIEVLAQVADRAETDARYAMAGSEVISMVLMEYASDDDTGATTPMTRVGYERAIMVRMAAPVATATGYGRHWVPRYRETAAQRQFATPPLASLSSISEVVTALPYR